VWVQFSITVNRLCNGGGNPVLGGDVAMKKMTMEDIAKALDVSVMTVSKAFQNSADISETMRQKVFDKAKAIGYVYPKKKKTNLLVLCREIFLSKGDSFYNELFFKLSKQANLMQTQLSLTVVKEDQMTAFLRHYDFSAYDGIALMGQFPREALSFIELSQIPLVCIDFYDHKMAADMIVSNNFIASYEATSYLINLNHEKIHFIGTLNATSSINDRYFGYHKAMLEYNKHEHILAINDRNGIGLKETFELKQPLPTAYVCNNDHTASLLIKQLQKEGLRVPEDISVMGFDDVAYSRESQPPITTMRVSRSYMAEQALTLLVDRIQKPSLNHFKTVSLDCSLIERASTAPLKK
jgi:LacI family transcriptional regulator